MLSLFIYLQHHIFLRHTDELDKIVTNRELRLHHQFIN